MMAATDQIIWMYATFLNAYAAEFKVTGHKLRTRNWVNGKEEE